MNLRTVRRVSVVFALMLVVLLAGCPRTPQGVSHDAAAAATADDVSTPAAAAQAPVAQTHRPAPPKGGPLPPQRVVEPVQIDRSCKADADCVIKDIGSCCGAFPSCVNRDSPADPAAVKAACEKNGQTTHCSRRVLEQCACRQGQCMAAGKTPVGGWVDDAPSPPPDPIRLCCWRNCT
jgi:hypothetical protein